IAVIVVIIQWEADWRNLQSTLPESGKSDHQDLTMIVLADLNSFWNHARQFLLGESFSIPG
ncbi:MAG TPA: hypothetical protein VFV08_13470, partial [Puia sp.]|nr:hypothetical protein [Puia sp.]